MQKTRREITDPVRSGALVVKDLGSGYVQTQAGPNAIVLSPDEAAAALAFTDERPSHEKIHRLEQRRRRWICITHGAGCPAAPNTYPRDRGRQRAT